MSAGTTSPSPHSLKAAAGAVWAWWKRVAHRLGTFQARVILTFFYYVILGPFALVLGRKDPLGIDPGAPQGWRPRESVARPIAEQAHRQS